MSLNPLNPNYLNHINFHQQPKKAKSRPKQLPKQAIKNTQNIQINNHSIIDDVSYNLSAKFPLKNYLNTCNLQFTKEGYLIAYLRKQNLISGRSFIMFPEGIVANCNVLNRKLTGWIVICKKGQFYNISHFFGGNFDGDQYTYDIKCGLMVQSRYVSGKLHSVKKGVANNQISFQKYLNNKDLVKLLNETLKYNFYEEYLPKIQSKLGSYYGTKTKGMPFGLGILVTDKEYFYGNFQYGLLSGDGVMIFPNGNSYIGQFNEGMMRGYGNYIDDGNNLFKYNYTIVQQKQFKDNINIKKIDQNEQLFSIFGPIIHFYLKLKVIYQNRRLQNASQAQSFVDVQMQENIEESIQRQQHSSGNYSLQQNNITQLIDTNSYKQRQPSTPHQKQTKLDNFKEPTVKTKKDKKENTVNQNKNENKTGPKDKKKKQKWVVKDDREWEEMIEELADQDVSKQDNFLNPQQQKTQFEEALQLKKNPINSRVDPQNFIKITDSPQETIDQYENNLIKKLSVHK